MVRHLGKRELGIIVLASILKITELNSPLIKRICLNDE
jgi:hypothetical protein